MSRSRGRDCGVCAYQHKRWKMHLGVRNNFDRSTILNELSVVHISSYAVSAVSNCIGHDDASYAVLKHVEVEFWRGSCRCDTGTQCSVHSVIVKDAHFRARVLKRKLTGEGATPSRTEIWLFQRVNMDEIEIGWNVHGRLWIQRQPFFSGIHFPGPPALWASMQKPRVRVERLLCLVKQQKESNGVTTWQVNKTHRRDSGNLDLDCHLSPLLMTVIWSSRRRTSRCGRPLSLPLSVIRSEDLITLSSRERRQSGWPSLAGMREDSPDSWASRIWSHSAVAREDSPDGRHRQWREMAVRTPGLCGPVSPDRDFPNVVDEFCLHVMLQLLTARAVFVCLVIGCQLSWFKWLWTFILCLIFCNL